MREAPESRALAGGLPVPQHLFLGQLLVDQPLRKRSWICMLGLGGFLSGWRSPITRRPGGLG